MSEGYNENYGVSFIFEILLASLSWLFMKKHVTIKAYKVKNGRRRIIQSDLKIVITDAQSGKVLKRENNYTNCSDILLPHFIQSYKVEAKWDDEKQTRTKTQIFLQTEVELEFEDWPGIKRDNEEFGKEERRKYIRYPYVMQCSGCGRCEPRLVNSPLVQMARKGDSKCPKCGAKNELIKDSK